MAFTVFLLVFILLQRDIFSCGIKFSAESFSEISLLAEKGKTHLESLRQKANVPHFGPCWKNAISNLQIGCKFLSENVQSDLALMFTDCFLQMSDHEPLKCDFPRSACLKKLPDRAFNAYTEFYTHTQSICYFLQSQVWHEETEKTINKLSSTSLEVSKKLEEAGKVQEKLLNQQKESLILQHDIGNNSRNIASVLRLSNEKINGFLTDFKSATAEQKELLGDVFENLVLFRTWAVNEFSWFSSTIYFATATLLSYLFTSVSRTREARMVLFIIFISNYFFERVFISSSPSGWILRNYVSVTQDSLESWIWLCRKFSICLAIVILLYTALTYCDYNFHNYKLLLEIKNQNIKILKYFDSLVKNPSLNNSNLNKLNYVVNEFDRKPEAFNNKMNAFENSPNNSFTKNFYSERYTVGKSNFSPRDFVDGKKTNFLDEEENSKFSDILLNSEKVENVREKKSNYNLRSSKKDSFNF